MKRGAKRAENNCIFKKAIFRPKGYVYKNNGHPVENDVYQLKIKELE